MASRPQPIIISPPPAYGVDIGERIGAGFSQGYLGQRQKLDLMAALGKLGVPAESVQGVGTADLEALTKTLLVNKIQQQQEEQQAEKATNIFKALSTITQTTPETTLPPLLTKFSELGKFGKGNIDLTKRPIVKNADGSISTVRSMSFNEDGKEVLIPTVSNEGKMMSPREAIDYYHATGQYLGKFKSPDEANVYAKKLHEEQALTSSKGFTLPGLTTKKEPSEQELEAFRGVAKTYPAVAGEMIKRKMIAPQGELKTVQMGTEEVTGYFDPESGQLIREIGRGPKFKPETEEKTLSKEQVARKALREKLKREPTFTELQNELIRVGKETSPSFARIEEIQKDAPTMARMIMDGTLAPSQVKGGMLGNMKVLKEVYRLNPNFNVKLAQARYDSDKGALNRIKSQSVTVLAFERTATKNLDIALEMSNKVNRTGSPVLNRWLLAGKKKVAGDPDVTNFDASIRAGINEYAKVVNTVTGGGITSDTARKEIEKILDSSMTKEQIMGLIGPNGVIRREMENRRKGFMEEVGSIEQGLGGGTETPLGAAPGTAPGGASKFTIIEVK